MGNGLYITKNIMYAYLMLNNRKFIITEIKKFKALFKLTDNFAHTSSFVIK